MVDKIEEICRTCLGGNKNMFNMFVSGNSSDINLADMLTAFVSIKIDQEENLPQFLCSDCIKALTISYNFKRQCEQSDILLRSNKVETLMQNQDENLKAEIHSVVTDNEIENEEEHQSKDIFEEFDIVADKDKKYKCNLCERGFMKSGNLRIHMKTHSENNECTYCTSNFSTHQELMQHNKENHKYFNCTICEKSYSTGNALNAHMRMHKSVNSCSSEENAEYICVVGINQLPTKIENIKFEGEIEMSEKTITINCTQCGLPCINEEALQLHEYIHNGIHECELCQLAFITYNDFVEHNKTNHGIHNCSKCIKSFPTIYGLSGHSSTHAVAEENPYIVYKCTIPNCHKKYRTLEYLKQHTLTHTNENRVYLCKICGKIYNSSNSFYYHKKIHAEERPYVCKHCGNAYKIYSHLKTHLWRHGSKMPHLCNKCGKGFTRSQVLRKHIESNCGSKKRRKHLLRDADCIIKDEKLIDSNVKYEDTSDGCVNDDTNDNIEVGR